MSEKWIQKAIPKSHQGALRKKLHIKAGHNIADKQLEVAAKKPGKEGRQARLAKTLKKLHHVSETRIKQGARKRG